MADWLSGGAIPMGMLFMGITVFRVLRRKTGNVVARALYPGLAKKLGLLYTESSYKNGVGRLSGTYRGFAVTIDPDDQRRIFLRFSSAPEVEMHSFVHNKLSAQGQISFRPQSSVLARQFKTSHASPALVDALNEAPEVAQQLRPLKFVRELQTLSVTESGVTAIFDYGSPAYIPSEIVDDLLPRLAALAAIFEPPGAQGKVPVPAPISRATSTRGLATAS